MSIISTGYEGTIDEVQAAKWGPTLGSRYSVGGPLDLLVVARTGVDRTVRIGAGSGSGYGVRDELTTFEDVQLPSVSSGTRWDLIVLRRAWSGVPGTPGVTTVTRVAGTSARAIPAGRAQSPGSLDEQPLALVQVSAGSSAITTVVDLRCWSEKTIVANDLLGLGSPLIGVTAYVGDREYRGRSVSGTVEWVPRPRMAVGESAMTFDSGAGNAVFSIPNVSWVPRHFRAEQIAQPGEVAVTIQVRGTTPFSTGLVALRCFQTLNGNPAVAVSRVQWVAHE